MIDRLLHELRACAENILLPGGAFVRVDREGALFVSDAPRRGMTDLSALSERFILCERGGLLFLTPLFPHVPPRLRDKLLIMLKAAPAEREKLIRQALAESLRRHDAEEIAFLNTLYKEEIQ